MSELVAGLVVAAIAAWHVGHFLQGDGLRFDEARVAMNLVERDYLGLVRPLDYQQAAPIGFLWLEKTLLMVFGRSEHALRIVPLLAALAAPVLVWRLGMRIGGRAAGAVAAALLAVHPVLGLYACELKQYSLDAALALVLLHGVRPLAMAEPVEVARVRWLAPLGAAAVFFSQPAAVVVAGLAPVVLVAGWRSGGRLGGAARLAVGCWAGAVLFMYWISLAGVSGEKWAQDFWREAMAPWPPWSHLDWYMRAICDWLFTPWVPWARCWPLWVGLGAGLGWLAWRQRGALALILAVPAAALAASLAGKYPLNDRLLLFVIPCGSVLVAVGWATVMRVLSRWTHLLVALGAVVALIDFGQPLLQFSAAKFAEGHNNKIDLRPLLRTLGAEVRAEEILVATNIEFPARFYAPDYRLAAERLRTVDIDTPAGRPALQVALDERGAPRVRCLLTVDHVWPDWHDPRGDIEGTLRAAGRRFTRQDADGCSIYRIE